MDTANQLLVKILIIGDTNVGKSSIMTRFCDNKFDMNMLTTIGIDYKTKNVILDGGSVKIQIWDTAGQERFRSITTAYYRGTNGIMIVYDITQPKTFTNVKFWLESIAKYTYDNVPIVLVGNKIDMTHHNRPQNYISYHQGQSLADKHDILFFETSALTNINIDKAILTLVKHAKRSDKNKVDTVSPNTLVQQKLDKSTNTKSNCCSS